MRATAFSLLSTLGRVAAILAQVVDGILSQRVPTLLAATSACLALAALGGALAPAPQSSRIRVEELSPQPVSA